VTSVGADTRPLRIALATPRVASSLSDGVARVDALVGDAARAGAAIVCFPETFLPGIRGEEYTFPASDQRDLKDALEAVQGIALRHRIAVILPMEWHAGHGLLNLAFVISDAGEVMGFQTKNQIPIEEEDIYIPGDSRRLFSVRGIDFGIVICHEGWRYPETVRWAAGRGARIVFQPQFTGSDTAGPTLVDWGQLAEPFYERAMACRAMENDVWFASVNYATRYPHSATSLVAPSGECVAHAPYGQEDLLIHDVDPTLATGLLARRFAPSRLVDLPSGPLPDIVV